MMKYSKGKSNGGKGNGGSCKMNKQAKGGNSHAKAAVNRTTKVIETFEPGYEGRSMKSVKGK